MDLPGRDSKGERLSEQTMERLLERLVASKMISLKVGINIHQRVVYSMMALTCFHEGRSTGDAY
jgi:hypothetical protein